MWVLCVTEKTIYLLQVPLGSANRNVQVPPAPGPQVHPQAGRHAPGPGSPEETQQAQRPKGQGSNRCIVHPGA